MGRNLLVMRHISDIHHYQPEVVKTKLLSQVGEELRKAGFVTFFEEEVLKWGKPCKAVRMEVSFENRALGELYIDDSDICLFTERAGMDDDNYVLICTRCRQELYNYQTDGGNIPRTVRFARVCPYCGSRVNNSRNKDGEVLFATQV